MPKKVIITEAAKAAARLPYPVLLEADTVEGRPCFVASNPDLRGCLGQGFSELEAIEDLRKAREIYIQCLMDDGLPVPEPKSTALAAA